ncbi:helix-turn-helix transcriptional regulator [Brevundimonas sp. BAL450]|nr:helix-turn-helix transcriptional regulator [Brevundimonas sp. BAL450]
MVQKLSPREREYVRLAGEWLTDKEIAARVGVSPRTVSNTLARAMRKLGVSSRRDAARLLVSSDYSGHSIPLADDGRLPLHQPPKGGPDENRGRTETARKGEGSTPVHLAAAGGRPDRVLEGPDGDAGEVQADSSRRALSVSSDKSGSDSRPGPAERGGDWRLSPPPQSRAKRLLIVLAVAAGLLIFILGLTSLAQIILTQHETIDRSVRIG